MTSIKLPAMNFALPALQLCFNVFKLCVDIFQEFAFTTIQIEIFMLNFSKGLHFVLIHWLSVIGSTNLVFMT